MRNGKILIVEDEYIIALDLKTRLEQFGYQVLEILDDGEDALSWLEDHPETDIVLMDIHLQGRLDGIETASRIFLRFSKPVIFITAFSDDATLDRAKLSSAYGFIRKPVDGDALKLAIEMALSRHYGKPPSEGTPVSLEIRRIAIWHGDEMVLLDPRDVCYVEVSRGQVCFHTPGMVYRQRGTLSEWSEKMKGTGFYRCHKNYLVNLEKIRGITLDVDNSYVLRLHSLEDLIPVARNKTGELKELLGI